MNKVIKQIVVEKVCMGEIKTVREAQNVISKISDSRVSDRDIVNAICEVAKNAGV